MKMFISHKKEDAAIAKAVADKLFSLGEDCYLDVLDTTISGNGKKLTDHIKSKMIDCTDIIVVMSENTKKSQWVFFEVGMATQAGLPISTYLAQDVILPDFLSYWPRLHKPQDLVTYIQTKSEIIIESVRFAESDRFDSNEMINRQKNIDDFYTELKKKL